MLEGDIYLLDVGNLGMGIVGAGDVFIGIFCGFMVQGYIFVIVVFLGVCLYGFLGDIVVENKVMESLIVEDIIEYFGQVFKCLCVGENVFV